jgi:hypothetical protein
MQTPTPTRITIELHPGEGAAGWSARTHVEGGAALAMPISAAPSLLEGPDVAWTPPAYEAGECTCENGICDCDHDND